MKKQYSAVVIGASAGGIQALTRLLAALPEDFALPIMIALHLHANQNGFHIEYFNTTSALTVKEAEEKEKIQRGHVYFAPCDHHLLIEEDETLSLSADDKVNYCRPSIDVLFESAVDVYSSRLIGVILTGANNDGARGMRLIKEEEGLTIAQDPQEAEYPFMPRAAIEAAEVDYTLLLNEINRFLINSIRIDLK